MASTRSKNTPGNYALEQSCLSNARHYEMYVGYNFHEQTCYAGQGLLPGRYPLQLFRDNCDVESELLGIGSTNLVTPGTHSTRVLKANRRFGDFRWRPSCRRQANPSCPNL